MTRHCRRLLLLLLLLLSISLARCHSATPTDAVAADDDDDDDLADLDDLDDAVDGAGSLAPPIAANLLINVNEETADSVIRKYENVLLLGYAPWCTQSQALLPEFAAVATALAESGSNVVLAKLDAINNPDAASRYNIRGFPTLIFFSNGSSEAYPGGNTREEIAIWLRKRTGLAATTITSKAEAESFLSKNVTAVLGYFDKFEGPEYDAFIAAARAEDGTEFVQTTSVEVVQVFIRPPFVAVRKPEPEHFSAFGGSFNKAEISSFVELNKHSLVTVLNSNNAGRVYSSPLKFHILLFAESEDYETVKSLYLDAAKDFKDKVMFLLVDLKDEDFSKPMLSVYGLDTSKPAVAGFNNEDGSRYLLESEVTIETVKAFAADFMAGKLPLHYKSEPVPAENEGVVKIVVGKTFDEIVMDDTKDVFLQVHAPWCVTCDKVNRAFEKLARHLQGVPSLVLAKYDAAANEHPLLQELPNYPALLMYPAGRKTNSLSAPATSHTSLKQLLRFVKENVAIPFTAPKDSKTMQNPKEKKEPAMVDIPAFEELEVNLKPKMNTEAASYEASPFSGEEPVEQALKSYGVVQDENSAGLESDAGADLLHTDESVPKDEL